MTTTSDICNHALALAKQDDTIVNISDSDTASTRCSRFYDLSRRSVLQMYPWSFSRQIVNLALLGEDPSSGYKYSYSFPSNALSILAVKANIVGGRFLPRSYGADIDGYMKIVNTSMSSVEIHTNIEQAQALICVDVEDAGLFDPLFIDLLASRIAVSLGYIYKVSSIDMKDIKALYYDSNISAMAAHANQEDIATDESNHYVDARE